MNYGRVNSGSERLDAKLQQKTFTPDRFPFDKHATTYGIDGFSEVIINAPENFSAENIKKDVTIAGVTGTYEGTTTPSTLGTADIKPTAFPTVKNASDDGVDGYSTVTVQAPDNLVAGNIKSGVNIAGVTGTYEGSGSGGAPDARMQFWYDNISYGGLRRNDEGALVFTRDMPKEYWPDKVISHDTTPYFDLNKYALYGVCLTNVELPDSSRAHNGIVVLPENCFDSVNQLTTNMSMTVSGDPNVQYSFDRYCFNKATMTAVPDVNYFQNTIKSSCFANAKFTVSCIVPEGITTLYSSAFEGITIVDNTITLPSTLTTMDGYYTVAGQYSKHINIIIKATTPPNMTSSSGISKVDTITVPAGTLEAYQTATNWSQFADIMVEATTETTEAGA